LPLLRSTKNIDDNPVGRVQEPVKIKIEANLFIKIIKVAINAAQNFVQLNLVDERKLTNLRKFQRKFYCTEYVAV
jgi:hypothetical protein